MEWLNFRHLYSFWMVKRTGGFKSAAKQMNVSQSTISEQVSLLEDYFEKTLFQRNTREVKLTEIGQKLFTYAETIFEKSREVNILIRDEQNIGPQTFKCGIIGGVSRNLVYRLLGHSLDHGLVSKFDVFNGSLSELTDACLDYEIDFFISVTPPMGKDLAIFDTRVIQKSNICITGDPKLISKIKRRRKKPLEVDLYHYEYPYDDDDILKKFEKKYNIKFNIKLETDDISLLRFFANSRDGVALIPEIGVLEDLQEKRLDKINSHYIKPIHFYAVYPKITSKKVLLESLLATHF